MVKELSSFGVIGLGVMGQNLALNIEERGFSVAVWNLEFEKTKHFLQAHKTGNTLNGFEALEDFVASLERPRRILMMIKAGEPVDQMLARLKSLLEPGDIVIDGGNSWFKDTQRREREMHTANIKFFGMGVSGGEEGARHGPSLMPGGDHEAYNHVKPVLEAIAAKSEYGSCVTYCGPDGAGHFVKMVHNGIEYGDMQIIAEAYDALRKGLGFTADQIANCFQQWNEKSDLSSFLFELSASILKVKDSETHRNLVDLIVDKAEQKGTGKWTVQIALELGVPIPTIAAAVDARVFSSMRTERLHAAKTMQPVHSLRIPQSEPFVSELMHAVRASRICAYAQGLSLIQKTSQLFNWNMNLAEVVRVWTGGCIIRAKLLGPIMQAFQKNLQLQNLLLDPEIDQKMSQAQMPWRATVGLLVRSGIPAHAMASSLAYFDSYRAQELPQNLIQAQRDAFGAHTYERVDKPELGFIHTAWK